MRTESLQNSSLHSRQDRWRDFTRQQPQQEIFTAVSPADFDHIPPAGPISPKTEREYCAKELAHLLGKHIATIYRWFASVPGVTLKENSESVSRGKRRYWSLTVPESVLIRFMNQRNIRISSSSRGTQ